MSAHSPAFPTEEVSRVTPPKSTTLAKASMQGSPAICCKSCSGERGIEWAAERQSPLNIQDTLQVGHGLHETNPSGSDAHGSAAMSTSRVQVPQATSLGIPLHSTGPSPLAGTPSHPRHDRFRVGSSICRHSPHASKVKPPIGTPLQSRQLELRSVAFGRLQSPHTSRECCPKTSPAQSVHAELYSGSLRSWHSPHASNLAVPIGTPLQSVQDWSKRESCGCMHTPHWSTRKSPLGTP